MCYEDILTLHDKKLCQIIDHKVLLQIVPI